MPCYNQANSDDPNTDCGPTAGAGATRWLADLFSVRTAFLGGAGLLVFTAGLGWVTLAAAAQAKTEGGAAVDTPAGQEAKGRAIEEAPAG